MEIKLGGTRIVFLFSKFVIKIPRIHFLYLLKYFLMSRPMRERQSLRFKSVKDVFKYIFSGFIANRNEYLYSQRNKSSKAIIRAFGLLWGIVVVQYKGRTLTDDDLCWKNLKKILENKGYKEKDTLKACNYGIWDNRICLLDYGRRETVSGLDQGNLLILEKYEESPV